MAKGRRKRRPGGGRKSLGEFSNKSATFTTRLQPETRRLLDEAAKASGRSVSNMAEFLLREALKRRTGAAQRNQALAVAVAVLAENIDQGTGADWRKDPFAGRALRCSVEALLSHLVATQEKGASPAIPPAVERAAEKMPPEFAERFRTPEGFGNTLAYNLALEIKEHAASGSKPNEWRHTWPR